MPPSKRKRSTIRSVAQHVNLSPTTVSLALRGDESISEETRDRVIEAARELDYHYVSRSRKNSRKTDIKRLVYAVKDYGDQPTTSNPFYGQILSGTEQAAQEIDAGLSFVALPHELAPNTPIPTTLTDDIDGIILASPYPPHLVDRISENCGCPIVLVDNKFHASPYDSVMADDFGAGYRITNYLLEQGHRHIRVVTGLALSKTIPPSFRERYRGYCDACEDHSITPLPAAVVPEEIDREDNVRYADQFTEWLRTIISDIPHPTAFFGTGDLYAVRVQQSLLRMGFAVPYDFSIVGCDDHELSRIISPALSTVRLYPRIMGAIAVRQLQSRINGDDSPPIHLTIGVDLCLRESAGPAPGPRP